MTTRKPIYLTGENDFRIESLNTASSNNAYCVVDRKLLDKLLENSKAIDMAELKSTTISCILNEADDITIERLEKVVVDHLYMTKTLSVIKEKIAELQNSSRLNNLL